jgi:hypothetical protein
MADKRIVRGLLDVVGAEADPVEWETYPDMYSDKLKLVRAEAELSRFKGVLKDVFAQYDLKLKPRPGGRPKKGSYSDELKAYACWKMARALRGLIGKPDAKITILELIKAINAVESDDGVPERERTFYKGNDSSRADAVTRGKRKLGIDGNWNSTKCEEIRKAVTASAAVCLKPGEGFEQKT